MRRFYAQRGMTALEVIIALSIFTVLLLILTSLQVQFLRFERDTDLEMFDHPERLSVLERIRRDVHDSTSYPSMFQGSVQSATTLILRQTSDEVIVWNFGDGVAERVAWLGGEAKFRWRANGVPQFEIGPAHGSPANTGVRLRAFDDERLIFDQVMFPRAR